MRVSDATVAAVIAAVEAFLDDEAASVQQPKVTRGISAWRMAYAGRAAVRGLGANVSWRGRD